MHILRVISALLAYPGPELKEALPALALAVHEDPRLPAQYRERLLAFIDDLAAEDLTELQSRYVGLFDRGRFLSLHLFEHVHGESRDRGQAMVELIDIYRRHGLELGVRELPDYLPLFLEFVAEVDDDEAWGLFEDAVPVVSLLAARHAERDTAYRPVFEALESLAALPPVDRRAIRQRVREEGEDEALVNPDRIWEEEAVTFLASQPGGCAPSGSAPGGAQPVHWVSRRGT